MPTLFVTRKFPPSVGGMETLAADVWATLRAAEPDALLIAHGGSNRALPVFVPVAGARTAAAVLRGRVDRVLVGDVLLYLLLRPLLRLLRVPHATMAMGKDVVWRLPGYRAVVRRGLRRAPLVLAISSATADAVRAAGTPAERVRVVRLGIEVPDDGAVGTAGHADGAREVRARFGLPDDAVVLLALGRLVRRKGVAWFVREVLPQLPARAVLLVAGGGEDAPAVADAARACPDRTYLLGAVTDGERELLMAGCDLFVQPNIAVPGDMEGFGLVAVEAAVRGACVVAADLEGLKDAVTDGVTGLLLPSGNAAAWRERLTELVDDPTKRAALADRFTAEARRTYSRAAMGEALRGHLAVLGRPGPPRT